MDFFTKNETKKLEHKIEANNTAFDERFFNQDAKIFQVLSMGKQIEMLHNDNEALKKYN